MKSDSQIQIDVMDELKFEPLLQSSEIGVAVKKGVVTLSGLVDTYTKKLSAESAAKRVSGVKAVAEDIQVGPSPLFQRTDTEIAQAVLGALNWHSDVDEEKIQVKVEDGNVTLNGEVEWEFQRQSAKNVIRHLAGVRSVFNLISVKPKVTGSEVERKISAAFHRSATIDSSNISVSVQGNRVVLSGKVRSFAELDDAKNAAWSAPGVAFVESKLEIDIPEYAFVD